MRKKNSLSLHPRLRAITVNKPGSLKAEFISLRGEFLTDGNRRENKGGIFLEKTFKKVCLGIKNVLHLHPLSHKKFGNGLMLMNGE